MFDPKRRSPNAEQAYVQRAQKAVPFTVTVIGGAEELKAYRAEQERLQKIWDDGRAERYAAARQRAIDAVLGTKPQVISETDKAEIDYLIAKGNNFVSIEEEQAPLPEPELPAKKSIFVRVKEWFANVWRDAFP